MAEDQLDRLIAALGQANARLQQLTDVDYPTAAYKGFSASGETLAEVEEAIEATEARVERLQARLDELEE